MKKAILLLHGFKRNDIDDFSDVVDFIEEISKQIDAEKIYNETWFENYKKDTLNLNYFDKRVNEIVQLIENDSIEELTIICFSTGTIIGSIIASKLKDVKINFFGVAPTLKAHILKWRKTLIKMKKNETQLKNRLGLERYERLKQKKIENRVIEKYPVKIIFFIWKKIIGKRKKELLKIKNAKFLIAEDDHIVKSCVAIKKLSKNEGNEITVKDFSHDLILRKEKEIFKDWLKENINK